MVALLDIAPLLDIAQGMMRNKTEHGLLWENATKTFWSFPSDVQAAVADDVAARLAHVNDMVRHRALITLHGTRLQSRYDFESATAPIIY